MFIVTASEMGELDKMTMEKFLFPQRVLMENAGRVTFSVLSEKSPFPLKLSRVTVLVGPGNNGGDGLVVARYLLPIVRELSIFLLGSKVKLAGASRENLLSLEALGKEIVEIGKEEDLPVREILDSDIIVDAIFGTGFKGRPRGVYEKSIETTNRSRAWVLSLDIPSGVHGDTGEVEDLAVNADLTVTMAFPKIGHLLYPGRSHTGELVVADIGIPEIFAEGKVKRRVTEVTDLLRMLPPRKGPEHKGNFGRVLTISGSRGYTGAAALASLASLRVGAGLSYLAIPESLNPVLETKVTEVITLPVNESNGHITEKGIRDLFKGQIDFDVVAIGPGIGRSPEQGKVVLWILENFRGPTVLDADAVVLLKGNDRVVKERKESTIFTPHPGELGHLISLSPEEVNKRRLEIAEGFAKEWQVILALKGAPTIISSPEGNTWINPTGNPGMASGGTGDVLTGMISGLIAQGMDPLPATRSAVFLHGLAGDKAASEKTEYSLVAGDILEALPETLKEILEEG